MGALGRVRPAAAGPPYLATLALAALACGARPGPGTTPDRAPAGRTAPPPAAVRPAPQDSACPATAGQRLLEAVNEARAEENLPSLRPHPELVAAARAHADDQAARGTVSHIGSDGSAASERVTRAGYRWATTGENVGAGYDDPVDVVMAWLQSPAHRAVILEPAAVHAGAGFTQASEEGYRWFWTLTVAAPAAGEETPAARCHP